MKESSTATFTATELPLHLTPSQQALLSKQLPPKDRASLQAYCAHKKFLATLNPDRAALTTYTRKTGPGQHGRFYAHHGAAQTTTRLSRLVLFATVHQEVDLSSAHLALLLASTQGSTLVQGFTILEIRQQLCDALKHTPFAKAHAQCDKHVIFRLLYGRTTNLISEIRELNFFVPSVLLMLAEVIEKLKPKIIEAASKLGYHEHEQVTPRNSIYFALEYLEAKLVYQLAWQLQGRHAIDSFIWLHDGFWLCPPAPSNIIRDCFDEACRRLHLPTLPLKINDLMDELQSHPSIFQTLYGLQHIGMQNSISASPKNTSKQKMLPSTLAARSPRKLSKRQGVLREPLRVLKFLQKKQWIG